MNAPLQKFLPIRCDLLLPTVDLAGARSITGLHENELKAMAEAGEFPAWNIARSVLARRELRILARSARDFAESKARDTDDDLIIRLIHGPPKPLILGRNWYRAWNCDSGHMIHLVEDNVLQLVPGTTYSQGRGCTPCLTWKSAIQFLTDRRIA